MSKRQLGEPVLRAGGLAHVEAEARAVNAEPWDPPPGMVKRRCHRCAYWFAAVEPEAWCCPDCASLGTRPARKSEPH